MTSTILSQAGHSSDPHSPKPGEDQGEDGWIIASIPEVAGVFSQGRTREEARTNVIDALWLMLSPEASDQREREALHLTIAV